jgi:hypothetical protein
MGLKWQNGAFKDKIALESLRRFGCLEISFKH